MTMEKGDKVSWRAINGRPTGTLVEPMPMTEEQAEQFKRDWLVLVDTSDLNDRTSTIIVNEESMTKEN